MKIELWGIKIGGFSCFWHFEWVQQPANADFATSSMLHRKSIFQSLSSVKKLESPRTTKIIQTEKPKLLAYLRRAKTFQFLTRDWLILKNTQSISHSPHPLAAGPIRNAENMECLLGINAIFWKFFIVLAKIWIDKKIPESGEMG